jgi:hypothetical protein
MGYGDCSLKIDVLQNGFNVEVRDPKIDAANNKPKSSWEDPWKTYAFSTVEEVEGFVSKHLKELKPPPDADAEFSSAFNAASKDDD